MGGSDVNTAVFYNDYKDLQVQTFIRPGVVHISNAASATIRGLEVEAAVAAGRGLRLAGQVSWLDATYDRYLAVGPGDVTGDAAGHRLATRLSEPAASPLSTSSLLAVPGRRPCGVTCPGRVAYSSRLSTPSSRHNPRAGLVHLRAGFEPRSDRGR